ncbi:H-NS family nucleoid-associated regulatory protein [Paraburkholderia madseniana]|uniref:H-NS family nucleoid-associated regulatory protein n=1 Tax=Paraburkholderia madseniana TaxID=2599607 RepID=UPI0015C551C1|nr:H-NS family nucleoid-associated regulatory protein [Paraburkholderia madseniana]NPT68864.1 H-NS histone family protein [Paraburkholderia madseniana]
MATTLEAMQAKIKKLQAQADALIAKQSSGVIEKIRELMATHGLTTADIDAHSGGKQRAKPATSVAKYRDPKSGATWSGHGRAPQWIAAAKTRDKYLVDAGTAAVKPLPAKEAKSAGAYVRGPQPAMYQDPKSGATWSGRGRAPAWLANVKDRSKFLIAGGAEATVATTLGAVSKAKASVKKAASKSVGATMGTGQRKGVQPALYRDLKSGATWSGRGRAPAWLSGAKDRSKYLIDGVSGVADSSATSKPKAVAKKVAATKSAPSKKVAVKKTAAKKAVNAKEPAKKAAVTKAAPAIVKNAPAKKALRKNAAVTAPVATVESGAESTT